MKFLDNIISKLYRKSTKAKLLVGLVAAGVIASSAAVAFAGWSPNRPVFDWNNVSQRVGSTTGPVFNSFINTPVYGDERAFFDAGRTDQVTQTTGFKDVLPYVTQGSKEVILRTYIHNNANPALNDAAHGFKGVAQNTTVRIDLPTAQATDLRARSYISASNATPTEVTDTAEMVDTTPFSVQYVPGSATIYNEANPNGAKLSDSIVSTGAKVGTDKMNGVFPGCFEFQAFVEIHVKILTPKLTIKKSVRMPGETVWHKSVTTKPGDTVQWLVEVTNQGDTVQHNVVASDLLPPHVSFVPGSAKWYSASQNGVPYNFDQFIINNGKGGYVFGNYAAHGGGFLVRFDSKVNGDFDPCSITISNVAQTKSTESPKEINDHAEVIITKPNCVPNKPQFSCNALTADVDKDNRFKYTFNVNASASNGATVKMYTYDFGDNSPKFTTDQNSTSHTYAQPGDYAVSATVTVDVNGNTQQVTGDACKTIVHIPTTPPPVTPPSKQLVNTGAGDVFGIFSGTSLVGAFLHRKWSIRRK